MEVFLIRHAETQANLDPTKSATITKKGEQQIQLLKEHLQNTSFDSIFSSDLERSLDTAKALTNNPIITKDLREILRTIIGGPEKPSRENREYEDTLRAENCFEELFSLNKKRVAVIAHGNIIRYFLAKLQNKDPKEMWSTKIDPASITIIHNNNILTINYTDHLKKTKSDADYYV